MERRIAMAWLEGLVYDLRFALRALRRDRGFTIAAIAMLALAIGLNVTVFAVMNTMLFRGFPLVKQNNRLVYLQEHFPSGQCCTSYPDYEDWRAQAHSFEDLAFVSGKSIVFQSGKGRAANIVTALLTSNTFGLLGVRPVLGRDFTPADEIPGAPPAVILSYDFWASRFDKRPDVVGMTVHVNSAPATVIGVMPEGFAFPEQHDLWMPLELTTQLQQRGPGGYMAVGRLRDGVSIQQARAELNGINRRLEAEYPATNRGVVPRVDNYSQFFVGPDAGIIYGSLWAAAWFVLLIACANLANLATARAMGKQHDFSVRLALGASQARMVRQILAESLTLATVAGALGWWIAKGSVHTWAVETASRFQILDYHIDSGTLAYLIAVSIAATILFSLAPIANLLRLRSHGALKGEVRGATQSRGGKRLAAILVAVQMALAIVLLAGAGVLARSLWKVVGAATGVRDPQNVLTGLINLAPGEYTTPAAMLAYFDKVEAQLRNIPGVEQESVASSIPVNFGDLRTFEIEGRPGGAGSAQFFLVGSDYFQLLGAAPVTGRDFNHGDDAASLPVAIVNQAFAAANWPGQQPLGERIRPQDGSQTGQELTVVGVVPNIMQGDPTRQRFLPLVYLPFRQNPTGRAHNSDAEGAEGAYFLARTGVPPAQLEAAVRAAIQKLDPDVTLQEFGTLQASFAFRRDRMDLEHAEMGKHAAVAPIFAIIALLLAAIGLYAVISHAVSQRTKEIGVRMAIGAAAADIRALIFRDGMSPVALGVILGLAASFAVNRILQSQLVGVSPDDPVTLIATPVALLLVALLACGIPARRAMNVDPAVALRHE